MKEHINTICEALDHHFTRRLVSAPVLKNDEGEVIAFLFHRLFTEDELGANIYPHESVTVRYFDRFLAQCRSLGYEFITPSEVLRGFHAGKRSVMITFDDGYSDNLRALPVLERHDAKATFFVSPGHVLENRRFWWDALYANGERSLARYQAMPYGEARFAIEQKWPGAFQPTGDIDRPMSVDELLKLAESGRAEIGHHSFNHTTLEGRDEGYIDYEIQASQEFFQRHLGFRPVIIAYPNGVYSDALVSACVERGMKMGLTCDFRSEVIPAAPRLAQLMRMGRVMISGTRALAPQISSAALRYSVKKSVYAMKRAMG
jgi:peptidoglycan/xylan/chitin deacetylase (PgdA/CDA1 family)